MRFSSFCFLFLCFLLVSLNVQSQDIIKSLESRKPGEGTVTLHQDSRITDLIGSVRASTPVSPPVNNEVEGEASNTNETGARRTFRTSGYRVQVYAGNNSRQAREEALKKASQVKEFFPELPVYTYFQSPRWLCRVGDFKSIEEADAAMRRLRATSIFKEVSIVREQINIQL